MSKQLTTWEKSLSEGHTKYLKTMNYDANNVPQEVKQKAMQEIGFAYQSMINNKMLQTCEPQSIVNAITNIARTSITLNPVMRLAYLVPRNGKCVLDFSYMGMISLLKNNGNIRTINAYIVYEDEDFRHDIVENVIHHTPRYAKTEKEHNTRSILGAYSIAKLPTGEVDYCFMPYWEIEKVKNSSKGADSKYSPWVTWKDEMIKKTIIKRHFKMLISVNDTFNSKLTTLLEVENDNNGLQEQYKVQNNRGGLGSAFIEEEVEETTTTENRIAEIVDFTEEETKETKVEEKVSAPKKTTKATSKRTKTKVEAKLDSLENDTLFDDEGELPNEVVDSSTGEIISFEDGEDVITDDMFDEIKANEQYNNPNQLTID